jgi:hypothetical protein
VITIADHGGRQGMLQVNLDDADHHIERYIKETCGNVGRITSVKLHRSPSPFALIEMSRQEYTYELAAQLGGSTFGTCALIHLEQKKAEGG